MRLDKLTAGYQFGSIVEEILQQHYVLGGANTELTFNAYVSVPNGIDEQTQRVIKEKANALGGHDSCEVEGCLARVFNFGYAGFGFLLLQSDDFVILRERSFWPSVMCCLNYALQYTTVEKRW